MMTQKLFAKSSRQNRRKSCLIGNCSTTSSGPPNTACPLIEPAWEPELYGYMRGKAAFLGCRLYAIGGMPDHIHVVVSIPPKIAVARLTGQLKDASSHHVNEKYTAGAFAWQTEYGVFSFSEQALLRIVRYVNSQKRHHMDNTLERILEASTEGA